jgi:hypothetical protein
MFFPLGAVDSLLHLDLNTIFENLQHFVMTETFALQNFQRLQTEGQDGLMSRVTDLF